MLFKQTVERETLDLLKSLMKNELLGHFTLVGGTALSLQIGHRKSIDLDLFSPESFDVNDLIAGLHDYGILAIRVRAPHSLIVEINGIKVDFIRYPFPIIKPIINVENFRLMSVEDIAAMKLWAIAQRGVKKDFWDLFYILKTYSIHHIFEIFHQKYGKNAEFMVIRSLTYFKDADNDADPIALEDVSWNHIKTNIRENLQLYVERT